MKYLEVCLQTSIFAPLVNRKHISLDYGVMVAQQVLVLFVQVRILVVQQRSPERVIFRGFSFMQVDSAVICLVYCYFLYRILTIICYCPVCLWIR